MADLKFERLAMLHSDGSMGVFLDTSTLEDVREEVDFTNENETEPDHLTRIVKVRIEIVERIEEPNFPDVCPNCGSRHAKRRRPE